MARREFPVEAFYSVEQCDCGGFYEVKGELHLNTNPITIEFSCRKCGDTKTFTDDTMPGVRFRLIKNNQVDLEPKVTKMIDENFWDLV